MSVLSFTINQSIMRRSRKFILSGLLAALISGCTLGPDFKRPVTESPERLVTAEQVTQIASDQGQKLVLGQDIPGQWWELFKSKPLNALIEQALKRNPSLKSAQAVLVSAQENRLAKASELLPALDATLSVRHQKVSGAQFGNPNFTGSVFTLYNASVGVTYTLDVFGKLQRELEGMDAEIEYQKFQLEGAFLTLAGNIVTAAIQEASLRDQIKATEEIIQAYEDELAIMQQQLDIGSISKISLLNQQTLLEQIRTTLPPLHKQLAQIRHELSALVGDIPGSNALLAEFTLDDLHLPEQLPLSVPGKLLEQRPDIRAQEAILHAASAQVGEMATNIFPDLSINANVSTIAVAASSLFSPGSAVWALNGALVQPIFHGAQFLHQKKAAIATFEQMAAEYRSTLLKAFQNVADVLSALEYDYAELKTQNAANAAAAETLELTRGQMQVGAASILDLLVAERAYQQTRIGQIRAKTLRYVDSAALMQALGGGWWNRGPLSKLVAFEPTLDSKYTTIFEFPRFRKLK